MSLFLAFNRPLMTDFNFLLALLQEVADLSRSRLS